MAVNKVATDADRARVSRVLAQRAQVPDDNSSSLLRDALTLLRSGTSSVRPGKYGVVERHMPSSMGACLRLLLDPRRRVEVVDYVDQKRDDGTLWVQVALYGQSRGYSRLEAVVSFIAPPLGTLNDSQTPAAR